MPKYIIEFKKSKAAAILEYNQDGNLTYYEHNGDWETKSFILFYKRFPFLVRHIEGWKMNAAKWGVKVEEVLPDLSFDRFWEEYGYKVGNKGRAEKLRSKLKDPERVLALSYLKTYETHLAQNKGQSKLYPETYLNQERWQV